MSSALRYRPEIDGLRTIAVLAVVLYHGEFSLLGIAILPGGYLGVDVFFVISGYLITSLIALRLQGNAFSIADFYGRRVRRILPIYYTVALACLPMAWLYMLPAEMVDFAHSGLASLVFASNFWFWHEDPYWAADAILKPLQHTWSLAVEEQFYVVWPILLLVAWRRPRALQRSIFIAIVLASLGLAEWASRAMPEFGFYLLPARLWELGAGGTLALLTAHAPRRAPSGFAASLPVLGLALIAVPMAFFDSRTLHPSSLTAIPVVGTLLVLRYAATNGTDPASRLLRARPMVWLGLRSYGFYLWHFPFLSFAYIALGSVDAATRGLLLAAALAVSALTYVAIERPCRDRDRVRGRTILTLAVAANLALGAFFLMAREGFTQRAPDAFRYVFAPDDDAQLKDARGGCQFRVCTFASEASVATEAPVVVLAGDSHARILGPGLHAYGSRDFAIVTAYSRCFVPPGMAMAPVTKETSGYAKCVRFAEEFADFISQVTDATVVFSARVTKILAGSGFDNGEGGRESEDPQARLSANGMSFADNLSAMFEAILANGNTLVLVYPIPEAGWNVPGKVKAMLRGVPVVRASQVLRQTSISTSRQRYNERNAPTFALFDGVEGDRVLRVYPHELLCDDSRCYNTVGEKILYIDDDHLTPYAADMLGKQIVDRIAAAR